MRSRAPAARWLRADATAALLIAAYAAMALHASTSHSVVFDEPFHLAAGLAHWTEPRHPHEPGNGILAQAWAALPLLSLKPSFPDLTKSPGRDLSMFGLGYQLLYLRGNPAGTLLLASRAMIVALGALLGVLVYRWSRALWGTAGALVSLALFAFCPTALAHGALVTTDMAAALGLLAATWALDRVLRVVSPFRLLASCLACGLLLGTKMSGVLVLPIAVLLALLQLGSGRPIELRFGHERQLRARGARALAVGAIVIVHACALYAMLWLVYDVPYERGPIDAMLRERLASGAHGALDAAYLKVWLLDASERIGLLPPAFVDGLAGMLFSNEARSAFAGGMRTVHGFWWFFPYAFAIKTPLGTVVVLLLAAVVPLLRRRIPVADASDGAQRRHPSLHELAPLIVLIVVYGAASVVGNLNIGHRHILPLYPALYVLAGASAVWLSPRTPRVGALLLAALAATAYGSLSIRPHYLAFFNRLARGPEHGYEHLVDSSLDWGQDLPGLAAFLRARDPRDPRPVYLSYFGTGVPAYYGIQARRLPGFFDLSPPTDAPLEAGIYCISATILQSLYNEYPGPWTHAHEGLYQATRARVALFRASADAPAQRAELLRAKPEAYYRKLERSLTHLRFARLLGYLRQRAPETEVGYSILVFQLGASELARALDGPPAELLPPDPGLLPEPTTARPLPAPPARPAPRPRTDP